MMKTFSIPLADGSTVDASPHHVRKINQAERNAIRHRRHNASRRKSARRMNYWLRVFHRVHKRMFDDIARRIGEAARCQEHKNRIG